MFFGVAGVVVLVGSLVGAGQISLTRSIFRLFFVSGIHWLVFALYLGTFDPILRESLSNLRREHSILMYNIHRGHHVTLINTRWQVLYHIRGHILW